MMSTDDLTRKLKSELVSNGADLIGIGDLTELPEGIRQGLPTGVSIAVKYPKEVIRGIADLPTQEYQDWYDILNRRLDALVTLGAGLLQAHGYQAIAQTREYVGDGGGECQTALPHKTVATRAGIGWIGKSALLVTREYGSMVRISSILTDAPLLQGVPVNESKCGHCSACQDACPAKAILGTQWNPSLSRSDLIDYEKCREMAKDRSKRGFGRMVTLCGKCIEICPYTKRYLDGNS